MAASCRQFLWRSLQVNHAQNFTKLSVLPMFSNRNGSRRHMCSTQWLTGTGNKINSQLAVKRIGLTSASPICFSAVGAVCASTIRLYSNSMHDGHDRDGENKVKPVFVAIPNPFKVIRNKIYFWMIRTYFDADFRAEDFISGAKQALCTISNCIAEGNFDQLDGLLSRKLLDEVKETCQSLALRDRTNIQVNTDDVLHVFPQNVAVHYDERGGKFLNILMRFWCHSMANDESDRGVVGLRIGKPPPGVSEEEFQNMGSVISCTYEFHRDFSAGVDPSWVVTYIQHGKWLNTQARWLPKEWS
ncbi:m-AAA protease-interacting protein 1, mitochondrial-like isoform X2 [Acanthaster planci]|uniref:M-AAA protease-interacting protein 1, mitochondrial-like isoform X2 n=1 Tax=Acanthaster planci TaxID=133434 RepID=A0A8B8A3G6_ACAPL|nr:m-AAA protease-interacting protein 1, mitochondrial-like isoform X2 [Acanthaster planci]